MILPRYWAKEHSEERAPNGKNVPFAVWRWSESSLEEARTRAREAVRRIGERIRRGDPLPERYAYGERPVREEIVREHRGDDGSLQVALTRNVYGALVLNTARVMFIDIDFALDEPGRVRRFLQWLGHRFGRPEVQEAPDPVEDALARLRRWVELHSGWGVRTYRTRAGLRYLVTHGIFEPDGEEVEETMAYLESDPRYRTLCRVQKSFRARLTPKPWRCGTRLPPARYPYGDERARRAMERWWTKYESSCRGWATCPFLGSVGSTDLHPEVEPIQRLHDKMTRVGTELPLA